MSASYPHPIIAREGWPFLAVTVLMAAAAGWFWSWWSVPFWLAALFVLQFFRDPPRAAPGDSQTVVSPADGRVLNAALDKASLENERNALWLRTPGGADVTCVQIAGLVARRILCHAREGDVLARGQRFGFIRFGSRVDVYVPSNAALVAALGDKVHAASTVIATLPRHA